MDGMGMNTTLKGLGRKKENMADCFFFFFFFSRSANALYEWFATSLISMLIGADVLYGHQLFVCEAADTPGHTVPRTVFFFSHCRLTFLGQSTTYPWI